MATFESSLKSKLIYVFAINDERHSDCLKIGETTIDEDDGSDLFNNAESLQDAAHKRIRQYTKTAGIAYQLLYTEISIFVRSGMIMTFNDKQVHKVLERSGIKRKQFDGVTGADEWYCCDLETVKKAISAVKKGDTSLHPSEITQGQSPIIFRPEQQVRSVRVNAQYYKDLIQNISERPELVVNTFRDGKRFWKINNNENMKLDAIVGNPPYQELDGGNNASAMPVYQHFVNVSRQIKPNYISMIMPSRWCVSGRGLDAFRESMLTDSHFAKMYDFRNGGDCFPGIRIGGGVCYILWDSVYNDNKLEITNMPKSTVLPQLRPKKEFGLDFLIRDNIVRSIIYKVTAIGEPKMSTLSFSQKPFGFRTNFMEFKKNGEIKLYTKKEKDGFGYVSREEVTKNAEFIDEWKVVTSRSTSVPEEDNGQVLREVQTFISEPGSVVTESYVVVASFKDESLAKNCLSYLKTKFFRILCQVTIVSPDVSARTFDLVPIQDFTRVWTDEELYAKYRLTDDEIQFVESMIRPMN